MKTDGKRDCTDRCAQHNRCEDKNGVPQDDAGDFKSRHSGVMHRSDATGNDGAADPWSVTPVRDERYREPCAGQQDGRDQRQDG